MSIKRRKFISEGDADKNPLDTLSTGMRKTHGGKRRRPLLYLLYRNIGKIGGP